MSIEISAKQVKPIRQAYSHITRRLGEGKTASRYQEATLDVQPTTNFHYASSYAPEYELYDAKRTAIVMEDWYSYKDPRQFYYSAYTITRAKQQEVTEKNFKFVENRDLLQGVSEKHQKLIREIIIPLRHIEWAANLNGSNICDIGYGTAITQTALFDALDRLGIGQYITRISLILEENDLTGLDAAKDDWLNREIWQGLRHAVEDMLVLKDWFELLVAQNIVLDGLLYPLIYDHLINEIIADGGSTIALLTEFMSEWNKERVRWTNALIKITAKESEANKVLLNTWVDKWSSRIDSNLTPIANAAFAEGGSGKLAEVRDALRANLSKQGL